jgi:hypothetical protein
MPGSQEPVSDLSFVAKFQAFERKTRRFPRAIRKITGGNIRGLPAWPARFDSARLDSARQARQARLAAESLGLQSKTEIGDRF